MDKILILGAYGYLGCYLSDYLSKENFRTYRQGRSQNSDYVCNPNNREEIDHLIIKIKPDCIVNLISDTNVDN